MAFKILTDPTFTTQAVINVPTDAGILEQTVTARFRMLPVEDGELTLADFVAKALISLDGVETRVRRLSGHQSWPKPACSTRLFRWVSGRPTVRQ
jgi:hypothetical protein